MPSNPWPNRQSQQVHAAQRGRIAAQKGEPLAACPYQMACMRRAWMRGWRAGVGK